MATLSTTWPCGCREVNDTLVKLCDRVICARIDPLRWISELPYPAPDWRDTPPFAPKKRTICADCRWYKRVGHSGATYEMQYHVCAHLNARDIVTGEPTHCRERNSGACPDFQAKEKP